ncbi:hypothetical protein Afe05nite_84050 [Paractinoplanes ferrugineus]|uniref:Uncharacterized protein n=1 Tax=Paractinoplanes ferrugineus TaxID=113564 RepID=A0A919JA53_9ACTN|nr:hypothetical protein Afe05nite_84050 [Actinoplanes ferrugineus]
MRIGGTDLTTLTDQQLTMLRRDHVGFVFQKFNLLPVLSAAENITLPPAIAGRRPPARAGVTLVSTLTIVATSAAGPGRAGGGRQGGRPLPGHRRQRVLDPAARPGHRAAW